MSEQLTACILAARSDAVQCHMIEKTASSRAKMQVVAVTAAGKSFAKTDFHQQHHMSYAYQI